VHEITSKLLVPYCPRLGDLKSLRRVTMRLLRSPNLEQ